MTRSGAYDYDIAVLSDFRYPGGTSVSVAEEIKAQAAAGYSTALVPARSPHLTRTRRFHSRIINCVQTGMGEMVDPDRSLRVKALVIRHPAIFTEDPEPRPRIEADVVVMVVNQTPGGESEQGDPGYYDVGLDEIRDRLLGLFGGEIIWAPIGPVVRDSLLHCGVPLALAESDWHNVLDADAWRIDRTDYVADRPVIGRHSRPHWKKWPPTAEQILAVYPSDDAIGVKVLGGGEVAAEILGQIPPNWTLYPFGSVEPDRFLHGIDFGVYFYHPEFTEAFGRTIAESLASGCPTIVPGAFRKLFEDACLYAEPHEVRETVERLYQDPAAYREQSERGHGFVKDNFGHEVHRRRIEALIGEPGTPPRTPRTPPKRRSIIFFTANGEGMGHLTRQMAIARRLPDRIDPIFVTLSLAMKVVKDQGYLCEYIPQARGSHWTEFLEQRLVEIIHRYKPDGLLFDGTWPFTGLMAAQASTGLPFAWVRRGMWSEGLGEENLSHADRFELVIEPGEFAAEYDRGRTTRYRDQVRGVDPILLLDDEELLEAADAKRELGLDAETTAVLVQLGSGNTWDVTERASATAEHLLQIPDLDVVFVDWLISRDPVELPPGVKRLSTYPVCRHMRAFDFAVSAAGYNSFHELIAFGVPTIFVPTEKHLDDQHARTRYAQDVGVGLNLEAFSEHGLERCLELILDHRRREEMAERCRKLFPGNGAQDAADAVAELFVAAPRQEVLG